MRASDDAAMGAAAAGAAPGGSRGTLFAVGVGPGDPGLLTLRGARVLAACEVVAAVTTRDGATTALDVARAAVPELAGRRVVELRFPMSRDASELRDAHAEAARAVCAELVAGRDVAMPVLGDPSVYASFHHLKPLVEAAGFATRVVPGVTSFCAVAAELGESLTPGMGDPLHVIPAGYADVDEALALPGAKVFMKAGARLGELRDAVRAADPQARVCGASDCGLPGQRLFRSLDELPDASGYFTTIVVRP